MFAEDDPLDFGDADEDVVDLGIDGNDEPAVVDLGFDDAAAQPPVAPAPLAAAASEAAPASGSEAAAEASAVRSDAAPQTDAGSTSGGDGVRIAGAAQAAAASAAPAAAATAELPPGWERVEARSGGVYFFHAASETATWTFPTGPPKHSSPAAEPAAASAAAVEAPGEKKGLSIFGAAARSGRQAGSSQEPPTREADAPAKKEELPAAGSSSSTSRQDSDASRGASAHGRTDETAAQAAAPADKSGPTSPTETRKRRWGERFDQDRQKRPRSEQTDAPAAVVQDAARPDAVRRQSDRAPQSERREQQPTLNRESRYASNERRDIDRPAEGSSAIASAYAARNSSLSARAPPAPSQPVAQHERPSRRAPASHGDSYRPSAAALPPPPERTSREINGRDEPRLRDVKPEPSNGFREREQPAHLSAPPRDSVADRKQPPARSPPRGVSASDRRPASDERPAREAAPRASNTPAGEPRMRVWGARAEPAIPAPVRDAPIPDAREVSARDPPSRDYAGPSASARDSRSSYDSRAPREAPAPATASRLDARAAEPAADARDRRSHERQAPSVDAGRPARSPEHEKRAPRDDPRRSRYDEPPHASVVAVAAQRPSAPRQASSSGFRADNPPPARHPDLERNAQWGPPPSHVASRYDPSPAMNGPPAQRERFAPVEPAQQRGPPSASAAPANGMRAWGVAREPPAAASAPRDEYRNGSARDDRRTSATRLSREPDARGAYASVQRSQEPPRVSDPRRDYPPHEPSRAEYGAPPAQQPSRALSPRREYAPPPARDPDVRRGYGAPHQQEPPRGLDSQRDYRAAPAAALPPRDVDRRDSQRAPMREWGAPREHSSYAPPPPQQHAPRDVSGDMRSIAEREAAVARKERELQERERAILQASSVPRR